MEFVEFPVTIPNQQRVETAITYSAYFSVFTSVVFGLVTNSLENVVYAFGAQTAITLVLTAFNWPWFTSAPGIEWLPVEF
ncbi:hypothetical protein G9P44_005274 [Scheffersomyces stipitis]|nr:hypothetical protein G9P44_005274 [Scheffersomyces stipitis]